MKTCSIYSRVSTGEQDAQNQTMVLTEWAKQRGFKVVKINQEEESALVVSYVTVYHSHLFAVSV